MCAAAMETPSAMGREPITARRSALSRLLTYTLSPGFSPAVRSKGTNPSFSGGADSGFHRLPLGLGGVEELHIGRTVGVRCGDLLFAESLGRVDGA